MLRDDYIPRPALHGVAQALWSADSGDIQRNCGYILELPTSAPLQPRTYFNLHINIK
jgi:hypothetical protein